jgi:SPP1 gp7 family putative phage head morphogenesis protein
MNPELPKLENALNNVYLKIWRQIRKDPNYPDNYDALLRRYDRLVYDNTRSAIQQAVILGNEKVNRIFKTQPYLTQVDIDLIKKNSKEQTASFWRKIQLDIFRKQEQKAIVGGAAADLGLAQEGPEPPPDIDMTAYLLAVAIASLFGSFADSTLLKTTELADTIENKPRLEWVATVDERTCRQLPDGSEGCGSRNGRIYDYDDPELEAHTPGTGTHAFCRCELIPLI